MNNKNVSLIVNGMHCGSCANKITNGIKSIQSDADIEINLETKNVSISYNEKTASLNNLKDMISNSGFTIESIELH